MAQAVYLMLLIPSYTNVAQHTLSYILTAHLLIDFWMLFELKTSIRQGCLSGSLVRVYKSRNLVGLEFHNLRSGPILAILIPKVELKWVYRRVESLCKLLTTNNV